MQRYFSLFSLRIYTSFLYLDFETDVFPELSCVLKDLYNFRLDSVSTGYKFVDVV